MTTVDVLIAARAKIADIEHWTQEASARRADGSVVVPESEEAVSWCAAGALCAVAYPSLKGFSSAFSSLVEALGGRGLAVANDTGQREKAHARIIAGFDAAISRFDTAGGEGVD